MNSRLFKILIVLALSSTQLYSAEIKVNSRVKMSYTDLCVHDDFVWISGEKGLLRLTIDSLFSNTAATHRKTSRKVLCLASSRKGIWVALEEKGLYLFNPNDFNFKGYYQNELRGGDGIVALKEKGGSLYLALASGKMYAFSLSCDGESCLKKFDGDNNFKGNNKVLPFRGRALKLVGQTIELSDHNTEPTRAAEGDNKKGDQIVADNVGGLSTDSLANKKESEKSISETKAECKTACNHSGNTLFLYGGIAIGLVLYTIIVVFLTARKYKRDLRTVEDEFLKRFGEN